MPIARQYEIRLFDRTLVEFSILDTAFGPEIALDEYDTDADHLMPCGLVMDSDGIWNWLEARSIPINRKNAAQLCRSLGFELRDREALYRTGLGLSLNDSYWVVPRGFSGRFDDYNLFDNPFSEASGALAVAAEPRPESLHGNTPELTTDGSLRKGWRIVGGKRVLYKGSSDGYVPGEPISEYLASLIGRDLGLGVVPYGIDTWEGELCSTCENFASMNVSEVPFAVATGESGLAGVLRWCADMGHDCLRSVCNMLVFDALICNTDRHLTNFGILRDNTTGLARGLAPIFDNGRGLFPNVAQDDSVQFMLEAQLRSPAFGGSSFEQLVGRIVSDDQRALLVRAVDRGIVGNVYANGRRVAELDAYLRNQAGSLLEIAPVDFQQLLDALHATVRLKAEHERYAHRLLPRCAAGDTPLSHICH